MTASWLRILELLRKELRQLLRDPKTKRVIFLSPVLQLVLFGYAVTTDVHDAALFVVDHDRTAESRALVDALTASGYFRVVGGSDSPGELIAALDRGSAVVGVQIPPDFAGDLRAGRGAAVQVLVDGTNSNTATVLQGYAGRIVRRYGARAVGASGAPLPDGVDMRTRAWYNPELASRVYNVPAVIGAILMLMALLLTALAVVRERELGTLDQLLVSPLSPDELILGKILPVAVIALVDLALVAGVAIIWFDIPFRGSLPTLLYASGVYILASLGMGLLISTVSKTQQEAFMAMFLLFLPTIVLSGFLYPIDTMPEIFQTLTLLNPVRHFLEIVRALFLKGSGFLDLWPQLAAVTAMAAGAIVAAIWRFRRTIV